MKPFSLDEVLAIASDPMAYLTRPLPLYTPALRTDAEEIRYHYQLGLLQALEGQTEHDHGWTQEPCDGPMLEAYRLGFARGFAERRAA